MHLCQTAPRPVVPIALNFPPTDHIQVFASYLLTSTDPSPSLFIPLCPLSLPTRSYIAGSLRLVASSAATCLRWFFARGFFYPEDGVDTILRNVRSIDYIYGRHTPEDGILHLLSNPRLYFKLSRYLNPLIERKLPDLIRSTEYCLFNIVTRDSWEWNVLQMYLQQSLMLTHSLHMQLVHPALT
jgi:hypothetical protein